MKKKSMGEEILLESLQGQTASHPWVEGMSPGAEGDVGLEGTSDSQGS